MDVVNPITDYIPASVLTTQGDLIHRGAAAAERLAAGAADTFLKSQGAGASLVYQDPFSVMTNDGDMIYRGVFGATYPLHIGSNLKGLYSVLGIPSWQDSIYTILTTQGDLLVRGALNPERLAAGNSGQALCGNGAGATPSWQAISGWVQAYIANTLGVDAKNDLLARDGSGLTSISVNTLVSAYPGSDQYEAAAAWHDIEFDTEVEDVNSDFNTGTYTFTAPRAGPYMFHVNVELTPESGNTQNTIRLLKNGSTEVKRANDGNLNDYVRYYCINALLILAQNDTIKAQFYSETAGATVSSGHNKSWFDVVPLPIFT
jgi:hypothetical protein